MSMPSSRALVAARPRSRPVAQRLLELAALLGQVAAAVGRHLVDQAAVDLAEQPPGRDGDGLGSTSRPDEGEGADPFDHEVGQQVGDLAGGRAAYGRAVLAHPGHEGRLPQRQRRAAPGRAVVGDRADLEPGQPAGRDLGLRDRRGGEHEGRMGAVERRDAPQAPQDLGDVGAEDSAVVVALVDDHVAQRPEEARPARVSREQRAVQHVGVGEDVLPVVAGPLAHLRRRVAVVGRAAEVGQPRLAEATQGRQLVLGECLGGREIEDARPALPLGTAGGLDRVQARQQVARATCRRRCRSR